MRGIRLSAEAIQARAEGFNELRDGVPVLTRIRIHYDLEVPPGTREAVDRALGRHVEKCPSAQSLKGAVRVEWTAAVSEGGGEPEHLAG